MHQRRTDTIKDARDVIAAYSDGVRDFSSLDLDEADFSSAQLAGASFYCSSLRDAKFNEAQLTHIQLKGADLTGATLVDASINASDLISAVFDDADLAHSDLTGASLNRAGFCGANLHRVNLRNAVLDQTDLTGAVLDRAVLSSHFTNLDVGPLCDARWIRHDGPSAIDALAVIRSYHHPGLKRFMLACGVPPIFTEYMIDCARAVGQPLLESMIQSTFISYGGPDERFARRLYDALREHGRVFFFPESARVGERISSEVFSNIQEHDKVILVCSRSSLNRPGVLHEIQETIDREARDGGASYLLPIMLDDYLLTEWKADNPRFAEIISRRVVADFRKTARNRKAFEHALGRLLDALKTKRPQATTTTDHGGQRTDGDL